MPSKYRLEVIVDCFPRKQRSFDRSLDNGGNIQLYIYRWVNWKVVPELQSFTPNLLFQSAYGSKWNNRYSLWLVWPVTVSGSSAKCCYTVILYDLYLMFEQNLQRQKNKNCSCDHVQAEDLVVRPFTPVYNGYVQKNDIGYITTSIFQEFFFFQNFNFYLRRHAKWPIWNYNFFPSFG